MARLLFGTTFMPWLAGLATMMIGLGITDAGLVRQVVGFYGAALIALLMCRTHDELQPMRDYVRGGTEDMKS